MGGGRDPRPPATLWPGKALTYVSSLSQCSSGENRSAAARGRWVPSVVGGEFHTYMLAVLWALSPWIPTATTGRRFYYSHLTDLKNWPQRHEAICLRSPSIQGHSQGSHPGLRLQSPCFLPPLGNAPQTFSFLILFGCVWVDVASRDCSCCGMQALGVWVQLSWSCGAWH